MGKASTCHTVRRTEISNRGWGRGDKFNGREKIEWKSTNKLKIYFVFLSLTT